MAIENVSETLNAFNGFLKDILGYQELLDDPAKEREHVESYRASLNRQLGVMHDALVELGVPRQLGVGGWQIPIFEAAFGTYDEDTGTVVHTALSAAIDVTRQAIGRLEAMEAKVPRQQIYDKERANAELRADMAEMNARTAAENAANARASLLSQIDRIKKWRVPVFVGGAAFGWGLGVYRWRILEFFRFAFPLWNIAVKALLIALLALGLATIPNLIAEGGFGGIRKNFWTRLVLAVVFIILAITAAYVTK